MIYVGIDWAEVHHDVCVLAEAGVVLARRRIPDGLEGVRQLHAMVAGHAERPEEVAVGIETDRGLLVGALVAAAYEVYAINPFAVSRYRDRHGVSGAKSDPGDAKVLADLVRTDRHNHRQVAGDSELAEAVKVLARAHQGLVWARQRQVNALRNALRDFYPAAIEAFGADLGLLRRLGRPRGRPHPGGGPQADAGEDRPGASGRREAALPRPASGRDPDGPAGPPARGASGGGPGPRGGRAVHGPGHRRASPRDPPARG